VEDVLGQLEHGVWYMRFGSSGDGSTLPTESIAIEIQIPDVLRILTLALSDLARGWDGSESFQCYPGYRNKMGARGSDGHSIRSILNYSQ
jgi:hypothetical protein